MTFTISSDAFANDAKIPLRYSRDGENVSPPLLWDSLPEETAELALVCDDPDAPTPEPFVHWVIYGMNPDLKGLPEGVPAEPELSSPVRAKQGENSWGRSGYDGPAPPRRHGVHHYHFTLYALSRRLEAPAGLDKARLLQAMEGAVLGKAIVTGTYER